MRLKHDIYFLYSDPTEGSRTGHAAIAVTRDGEIVRYFSMYHAWLPDQIRKLSTVARLTTSIPSSFVTSYEQDVIMRGQSSFKFQHKEKEEVSVPDILKELPNLNNVTRERYFNLGQFHHALKITDRVIDPYVLIKMLDEIAEIRNSVSWAMCSPFTRFFFDKSAHNCCSAISDALSVSKRDKSPSALTVMMMTKACVVACIFAFYGMPARNEQAAAPLLSYLPMLYPLFLVMQSLYYAHLYVTDLKAMAKRGGPDLATLSMVYFLCGTVNVLGSPFTNNACLALFVFPGALARSILAIPDTQKLSELPSIFMRLPKTQREEAARSQQVALVV